MCVCVCVRLETKPWWIKHRREWGKLVMGVHAKFTFASGQGRDSRQDSERENPQRIGFCYKIQLKIISGLDLIFHHIVIVHSNLSRRNLTQHVEGLICFPLPSPQRNPQDATAAQCKVFIYMEDTLRSALAILTCAQSQNYVWHTANSSPNMVLQHHQQQPNQNPTPDYCLLNRNKHI